MAGVGLGGLISHVLQDSVRGLVGELEAAAEVDELRGDAGVENGVASVANRHLGWGRLVLDGLLGGISLVGRDILAGG